MSNMAIIDAHQHFWDLDTNVYPWLQDQPLGAFRYGDYAAIRKNYLPSDYRRDAARRNIAGTVHVEAEFDPSNPLGETRWLHKLAEHEGLPSAIVGQAWFAREDIAEVIAGHAAFPLVRSIRQKPAAAPSADKVVLGAPGSMADPVWRSGYRLLATHGLSYDLQTPWWHLHEAAELAHDFPDTTIILNHAGLPSDRSPEGLRGWREGMEALADQPNTALKISGIGLPGRPWSIDDNGAVVLAAIEVFGVDRCMFASNYPVDSIVAEFDTIYDGFNAIVADLAEPDRSKLFHDNAARYYRLSV